MKLIDRISKWLGDTFAPRTYVYKCTQTEMNKVFPKKEFDKVFGKMDETFREMDKLFKKL